ncbi:MAG: TraR/DksA family transcriptional regulator [Bacteroidia bacterium]|nr:TraR/DksA family transcriptional regulator [Bacteroidia bacterium]
MSLTPALKPLAPPVRKEDAAKQLFLAQKPSVSLRIPVKSVLPPAKKSRLKEDPSKTRYNDKELEEFRGIILDKIKEANKELATLQQQMTTANDHGTDDTASTFKILEDGSDTLAKEEAGLLAARQKKFIEQLENALIRIENKTYGICRVTGKLIPKERLRAVPHTTQSIEAKLSQYRD